jgi:hypothetical protein
MTTAMRACAGWSAQEDPKVRSSFLISSVVLLTIGAGSWSPAVAEQHDIDFVDADTLRKKCVLNGGNFKWLVDHYHCIKENCDHVGGQCGIRCYSGPRAPDRCFGWTPGRATGKLLGQVLGVKVGGGARRRSIRSRLATLQC